MTAFIPVSRMLERTRLDRDESDTSYFFSLLYLGEMVVKVLALELLAALQQDREQHRYAIVSELVRADGVGKWAEHLDQIVSGPASQHIVPAGRIHSVRSQLPSAPATRVGNERQSMPSMPCAPASTRPMRI